MYSSGWRGCVQQWMEGVCTAVDGGGVYSSGWRGCVQQWMEGVCTAVDGGGVYSSGWSMPLTIHVGLP